MNYKDAYQYWDTLSNILDDALDQGVPEAFYKLVAISVRACEDELTAIENKQLQNSQAQYSPVFQHLSAVKGDLEEVKDDADQIVNVANQAGQVVQILTSLLPLIA